MFAHCKGVYFRCLDEFGDPIVHRASPSCLQQAGFEREDALFPNDNRVFEGFDLLREFFVFPRKFLGFNLTGLAELLPQMKAKTIDILFAFNEVNSRLAAAVRPEMFGLYAAPAINLFEKAADRIALNRISTNIMSCRIAVIISTTSRIVCWTSMRIIRVGRRRYQCIRSTRHRSTDARPDSITRCGGFLGGAR